MFRDGEFYFIILVINSRQEGLFEGMTRLASINFQTKRYEKNVKMCICTVYRSTEQASRDERQERGGPSPVSQFRRFVDKPDTTRYVVTEEV